MARNPKATKTKSQSSRARPTAGRPRRGRPKVCIFCSEHATWVDYKDVGLLKRFVNDRGRIKARGATGTCAQHQRDVATAVKTARELALLPYSVRTSVADSRGGRGGDRRKNAPAAAGGEAPESGASVPSQAEDISEGDAPDQSDDSPIGAPA